MSGQPGRSGRPAKPLSALQRAGTFRKDRHGHLLPPAGNVVPMPTPAAGAWHPDADDRVLLAPPGQKFVDAMLARFEFDPAEGRLLLEAGHAIDMLNVLRSMSMTKRDAREVIAWQRLKQGWVKALAGLLAQLRVSR